MRHDAPTIGTGADPTSGGGPPRARPPRVRACRAVAERRARVGGSGACAWVQTSRRRSRVIAPVVPRVAEGPGGEPAPVAGPHGAPPLFEARHAFADISGDTPIWASCSRR